MTEQPNTPQTDDTDNDTEGHGANWSDRDLKGDIADVPDDDNTDDTEGHRLYSDRDLKEDIAEVPDDDTDDTEGHGARFSGALPQEPTENDTEGHVQPPRGDDTDHVHS